MTYRIMLSNTRKVSEFVGIANKYSGNVRATSGKYTANAKSIMGMLTLDLTSAITVEVEEKDSAAFFEDIQDFLAK